MIIQTESWQKEILDGAQKKGELHLVYYCLEMRLPKRLEKKTGVRRMIAQHPVGYYPVVRLGPMPEELPSDPAEADRFIEEYREWAKLTIDLLRRLLEAANADWLTGGPSGIEFKPSLVAVDDLPPYTYEWWESWAGELPSYTVDRTCPWCGGISTVPRNKGWECECGMEMDCEGLAVADTDY